MEQDLLRFVNEDLLAGDDTSVAADDELVLTGTIDSLGVARLVGFIEGELGIPVPAEGVTIENFRSINAIAGFLRLSPGSGAEA